MAPVKAYVSTSGGIKLPGTNGLRKQFEGESLSDSVMSKSERPKINYDKCKLIVTVGGPLSETVDQLAEMLLAGMTVARFDCTAGARSLDDHWRTLENLRAAQKRTGRLCAVHCALGGNVFVVSKRTDAVRVVFAKGQTVRLVHGDAAFDATDELPLGGDDAELDFARCFAPGDAVSVHPFLRAGETVADLAVVSVAADEVVCECLTDVEMHDSVKRLAVNFASAGALSNGAKPNAGVPSTFAFNARDDAALDEFAAKADADFVSVGFAPDAKTLVAIRATLRERGLPRARLIAQIDTLAALRDLPAVIAEADVILLARGELGSVVAPEKMFAVQKHVLRMCERVGRPCVVTRLMDSMIFAPRPTRAEATDIANIVLDGADGLLLGLETLEGKFPLDCLETTLAIAREADAVYDYESRYRRQMQQINVKLAKATDSVPWGERDAAIVVPQAAGERGGSDAFGGDKKPPAVDARDAAGARRQPLFSERRRANSMAARLEQFELEPRVNLRKEALSAAAVQTAYQIDASLIVVFSHTGETTRLVAKYHPQCPVLSLSIPTVRGGTVKWTVEGDAEARQQLVYRGVVPALSAPLDLQRRESEASHIVKQAGASKTDVEALSKAAELGLIKPGQLAVFCQLIAGLSTVKVVEFAGMSRPKSQTFSPGETRAASPSVMNRVHARRNESSHLLGHIGTEADLVAAAAAARHAVAAAPESPTKERAKKPKKEKSEKVVKEKSSKSKSTRKQ